MALLVRLNILPTLCVNVKPQVFRTSLDYATSSVRLNRPTGISSQRYISVLRGIKSGHATAQKQLSDFRIILKDRKNARLSLQNWISSSSNHLAKVGAGKSGNPNLSLGVKRKTTSTLYYITALGVAALGLSYAAVPLYRIFCQAYSYGGTTQAGHDAEKVESMQKVEDRVITVRFNADTAASMTWNFRPQQIEIKVLPGETALAFYTARNPTDRPVIGVSTYNVVPFDAGQYFNKIQCFCFEEQLLNPHEEVHMPVFFYIDPEFVDDPKMQNIDQLTLSYTFFEAKEGVQIPIPNFART